MRYLILLFVFATLIFQKSSAQENLPELHRPLNIPPVLSGNFGELRSNHFHSGIDFKTQGRTGFKIHCAADGYVSRILVSPWGFGRAVYVTHPELGLVTVYGHLESFSSKINKIVVEEQYRRESFRIDMEFKEGEIPVKKGEVIALSGNAGSSGGPHLHMDVRDLATGDALDPMNYFKHLFKDNVRPEVRSIALYPHGGVVEDTTIASFRTPQDLSQPFTAWGRVAPAIKAYDKMPGANNIYGIKYLSLLVDGQQVYHRVIDRFSFDVTRGVNTLIEYSDYANNGWMMTTYVPNAHILGDMVTTTIPNGIIDINEERDYSCRFILSDEHGNTTNVDFIIKGKRQPIPKTEHIGTKFYCTGDNTYNLNGLKVFIPQGALYDDIYFNVVTTSLDGYFSDVHKVGDTGIALHRNYDMAITLTRDTQPDKSKYCLVRINGKRKSAVTAKYENGVMKASINRFGRYAVTIDKTAPKIVPSRQKRWARNGKVSYKISDNLSGIESYRGEIDGKWVMFEFDGKNALISYKLESNRVKKGRSHKVKITVTDACGNTSTRTDTFTW